MAFGGFASTGLALVAAALFLSAAMTSTGLDKRIALTILSRVGTDTRHVVVGLIVVGFVVAILLPSPTARVACLVPITPGIISASAAQRRVGTECDSTCRFRWTAIHRKKKKINKH